MQTVDTVRQVAERAAKFFFCEVPDVEAAVELFADEVTVTRNGEPGPWPVSGPREIVEFRAREAAILREGGIPEMHMGRTFVSDDGFVSIVYAGGSADHESSMCMVVDVADGKITRMEPYFDFKLMVNDQEVLDKIGKAGEETYLAGNAHND
jgi:ketosteroid isomerase-like protein